MKASQVQLFLFDGDRKGVQTRVNEFLRTISRGGLEPDITAIGYNYQGPEWDGRTRIDDSASHGIMLVAYYPTINEARAARGLDPISDQPGAAPLGEGPVVISAEDFMQALTRQAPQPKRGWWGRIKSMFRR